MLDERWRWSVLHIVAAHVPDFGRSQLYAHRMWEPQMEVLPIQNHVITRIFSSDIVLLPCLKLHTILSQIQYHNNDIIKLWFIMKDSI